jgi:hypothetical protein
VTSSDWTDAEVSFQVDLASGEVAPLPTTGLAAIGLSERRDLQQWISQYPEVVDRDLVLVTSEFDWFSIGEKRVSDRLDLLFVDSDGRPVVAELKRDRASDTVDMQALKYGAYCSTLTVEELVEEYARFHGVSLEDARPILLEHAPSLSSGELGAVRIRLVAGSFGPSVTSVVLWLRDVGLDIGCVQVSVRKPTEGVAVITARQLLPLPSAEEYVVRRRRRVQEEEKKEETARRRNAVTVLLEKELLEVGDVVRLKLDALTLEWRPFVEKLISSEPDVEIAEWTGISLRQALRWRRDGHYYSCSGLVEAILREVGFDGVSIPGPQFWIDSSGRSLAERAREAEGEAPADAR